MELNKLEKYKRIYKSLAPKIDLLEEYLAQMRRSSKGVYALLLINCRNQLTSTRWQHYLCCLLLKKEHLLAKKYSVFSESNDSLLDEYNSEAEIPEKIVNKETGQEVDRDQFYVEISFELGSH